MTTISAVVSYKSGTCGDFLTLLLMSGHPDIKLVEIGDHGSLPNSVYFQNKFDHNFYATMLGEGIVGKVNFFGINPRKDDAYFSLKSLENTTSLINEKINDTENSITVWAEKEFKKLN